MCLCLENIIRPVAGNLLLATGQLSNVQLFGGPEFLFFTL